ncbi:MAPEG family protein [Pelagovum pacificum]|uniref:MAPEG family protein n=1 Tax=Pelagovum pacificum TaxID=2588711 RepID=A0A5C5GC49_9RHOB|nr:MAPEG family protein [Pelagovum pacificum]QQA42457.1 MAPEG family protein [Pelagovum pacificum]TNY31540.1 MAPEG family protein [Pelagovum pacificum]
MTPELTVLVLAALLQVVQFALFSIPANMELGTGKTASPRDPQRMDKPLMEQVSIRTGRLGRAFNNHFEALILFTIAVVALSISDQGNGYTATLAWIYLLARVLYIPAYAFGWVPWRSLIFAFGFFATVLMLLAALF